MRFIAGVGMIFVPGVLSRFAPGNNLKAFLQLGSYGAAAQLVGKVVSSGIAAFAPSNSLVLQAYGPEVAAQMKMASVAGTSAISANAPGFAGTPRRLAAPAKTGVGGCAGGGNCGCANCAQTISSDPVADAQNAQSSGQPYFATSLDSGNLDWRNGNLDGGPDDCAPVPVTSPTLNTMPGGGPPPTVPPVTALPPVQPAQQLTGGGTPQCGPGQVWNAALQMCVTPHAPPAGQTIPGMTANSNPPPTSQMTPTRTVTPSTSVTTAVPHIIS